MMEEYITNQGCLLGWLVLATWPVFRSPEYPEWKSQNTGCLRKRGRLAMLPFLPLVEMSDRDINCC